MTFIDARPSRLSGLQEGRCQGCGGRALVDAEYVGVVRCSACWTALLQPPVPRPLHGSRIPPAVPLVTRSPSASERPGTASLVVPSTHRVLVGARPATGAEIPFGAQRLAHRLSEAGKRIALTYALAEELATGNLVHSCALRVDNGLGYAIWINGQAKGCGWWPALRSKISEAEFVALATGQPWTPPPRPLPPARFPCPRCMQTVRWTKAGQPFAHKREVERSEGGELTKVPCIL